MARKELVALVDRSACVVEMTPQQQWSTLNYCDRCRRILFIKPLGNSNAGRSRADDNYIEMPKGYLVWHVEL
jgi:hypothetical protein